MVVFERLRAKDGSPGYIYRGRERGKVEWMDFAVAPDGKGEVLRVLLLVYREPVGGEVGSKRFMGQFRGKGAGSALQLNRDIDGISGATISSRSITAGGAQGRPPLEDQICPDLTCAACRRPSGCSGYRARAVTTGQNLERGNRRE
jgi:hypothetical protein